MPLRDVIVKPPVWHKVEDKKPKQGEMVLARYDGVYGPRVVEYWFDGVNHHFGEYGPRVSRPITHWRPI